MSDQTPVPLSKLPMKQFFNHESVKNKFIEILGQRGTAYVASVLSTVNQSSILQKVEPESVYMAAMMAAVLDLPINPSLGCAYIVPYGNKAQFQLGYKGFVQLALRSGQFRTIDAKPVYEGQLLQDDDSFGGIRFKWSAKTSAKIIGYAAYFSLLNGFEKMFYMTSDEVVAHGKRYSKTFNNGPWKTDFDAMAQKTVLKLLLDKYAPKSIEMQKAQIADQAIIKDAETLDVDYIDNGHAMLDYPAMLDEIQGLLISNEYKLTKEEQADINRVIDKTEEANYQKVLDLLASRKITREE